MKTLRSGAVAATLLSTLALLSGCGGGFNTSAPERTVGPVSFANYVALGDGFAAGPYLGKDVSGTGCRRSADNYPAQVARALDVATVTDVTCVGATTKDLTATSNPPASSKKLAPQLDAVTKDTDLVTIGIGIEDNGLLRNMFHICAAEPCGDDVLAPTLTDQLDAYGTAISSAVRTILDVAPAATIVVVGYPQLMGPQGLCPALPAISDLQLQYAYKIFEKLNNFLRAAAYQTGASYIDVADLSSNHTACSDEPWVNGSKTEKGKVQAFHPKAVEQKAVADAIAAQVRIVSESRQ